MFHTGLRRDIIQTEIKSALDGPLVDDDDLIQTLWVIFLKEEERSNEMKTKKNKIIISAVESSANSKQAKNPIKEGTLSLEIRELRLLHQVIRKSHEGDTGMQ